MLLKNYSQNILISNRRRLQKLYEQKAILGISTPPEILTQIEDLEKSIQILEESEIAKENIKISSERVIELLEAMGYEILERKVISEFNTFLSSQIRLGVESRNIFVSIVLRDLELADYDKLRGAISNTTDSGLLICSSVISDRIRQLAKQENIKIYTYSELVTQMVDFQPYLKKLINEHVESDINKYYTEIHCVTPDGINLPISQYVDEWIKSPRKRHLSILGSFGTGKTWFCHWLVANQAKKCLADANERIPILISLREYSKAYDIVQVMTDLCTNRLKIKLPVGYETFDFLNKAGRFLLVFDGLDEMERRVSDYQAVSDNFWELARVSKYENSKVILTCRNTYFKNELEEKQVLIKGGKKISVIGNEEIIEVGTETPYNTINLADLTSNEIIEILRKRLGGNIDHIWNSIQESPDLFDLARRPSLIDMLIRVIPMMKIQNEDFGINLTKLFDLYIRDSLKKYDSVDSAITVEQRLLFLDELAWEMFITQQLFIKWSDFPKLVNKNFNLDSSPEDLLFYEKSLRTQSYLTRDKSGNYSFAHKSFMEFFVARKIFRYLDKIEISQDTIISTLDPDFLNVFGQIIFTVEIRNFIKQLLKEFPKIEKRVKEKLYFIIDATKASRHQEVKYLGGNAISLLHVLGESFKTRDFNNSILKGADLRNADLSQTNFRRANLSEAILSNSVLNDADLSFAELSGVRLEQMKTVNSIDWSPKGDSLIISCEDTNIKIYNIEALLTGKKSQARSSVLFGHEYPVLSVCWSPTGQFIASMDSERNIIIWNSQDHNIIKKWQSHELLVERLPYQLNNISRQIFFTRSDNKLLVGNAQLLLVLDMTETKPVTVLAVENNHKEAKVNTMDIFHTDNRDFSDWMIRYKNGDVISRIQHKNIAFERRTAIVKSGQSDISVSSSPTSLLSEKMIGDVFRSNVPSPMVNDQTSKSLFTGFIGYISPEFETYPDAKKILSPDATTAVYSPSRKYLAYGSKSNVFILEHGQLTCQLDLGLSCDKLVIKGATGLSPSALLSLKSKGVNLDEKQMMEWSKANTEERMNGKSRLGMTSILDPTHLPESGSDYV